MRHNVFYGGQIAQWFRLGCAGAGHRGSQHVTDVGTASMTDPVLVQPFIQVDGDPVWSWQSSGLRGGVSIWSVDMEYQAGDVRRRVVRKVTNPP